MRRNKQGELVFKDAAEERIYNEKKNAFLRRTEQENIRIFQKEIDDMLGYSNKRRI